MDVYNSINLSLTDIEEVSEKARDWLMYNGFIIKNQDNLCLAQHLPFILFPTPFPINLYQQAMRLQKDFQTLFHRASLDHEFIKESLKSVIVHDTFTKMLYEIYDQVRIEGTKPKLYFSITRSDYMLDAGEQPTDHSLLELKQIEMNTMAVGFIESSQKLIKMHRYIAEELGEKSPFKKEQIVDTTPLDCIGEAMATAFQAYGNENAVVVIVCGNGDRTRYMQRSTEYSFHKGTKKVGIKKHIRCLFLMLQEIFDNGELTDDKKLIVNKNEVALCYFRGCLCPTYYADQEKIDARLMIEQSICIKCPTMAEQLVGTKKIQQVFALPGVVEKFINDPQAVQRIRRTFAGLYTLDPGEDGDKAAEMALSEPSRFVLKPQREGGGGNNMYDEELVAELKRVANDPVERSQYILMERVQPPVVKNYIVHYDAKTPMEADTVTELGVFGVYISDGEDLILNESAGHLLRTKSMEHKDGGVYSGRANLDTPYLY